MYGFIDRNPEQMMRYGRDATEIIDEMFFLIRNLEGTLDFYKCALDTPSQKQVQILHECCNDFFHEMEVYRRIAQAIEEKGKRLDAIRSGGI